VTEIGLNALSDTIPSIRDRYESLAVLPDKMSAPLPVLQTLWNATPAQARRWANSLVDRSLALPSSSGGIALHDLQADYVRSQWRDRVSLDLIQGAIRLSASTLERDSTQFSSQIVGRLLRYRNERTIQEFVAQICSSARVPWVRPLGPALNPAGNSLVYIL